MPKIDLHSDLTLVNAFRFPVQSPAACRDLALGGLLLWIPVVGFVLNMGYRLQLVHRLQKGESPWPNWKHFSVLLRRGAVDHRHRGLPCAGVIVSGISSFAAQPQAATRLPFVGCLSHLLLAWFHDVLRP
jgi:hypothetical protein